jgi:hypothetical protein
MENQRESLKQYAHNSHGHDDIIMLMATVVICCPLAGLVSPHSPKLRLTDLKNEVR